MSEQKNFLLSDLFKEIANYKLCEGNRWQCANGHEWASTHGGIWLQMPACPECGQPATAHRGQWSTLNDAISKEKPARNIDSVSTNVTDVVGGPNNDSVTYTGTGKWD